MNTNRADERGDLKSLEEHQIQVIRTKPADSIAKQESLSKIGSPEDTLAKRDLDVTAY